MQSKQFLSKDGKVFGPYSEADLKAMKEKGEYYQYEWYWDGTSPDWTPVPKQGSTPPPLPFPDSFPKTGTQTKIEVSHSELKVPAKKVSLEKPSQKSFCAIAFDQRHSLGGEVMHATSSGGTFFSTPHSSTAFPKGSTVWLDLLDEETDKSAKIRCTVQGIKREGSQWILDLDWDSCPLIN